MSCSLPPEILDLIIDCLRDEQTALEACCLVSKSWVPRIRKHLFIDITLAGAYFTIQRWTKAFPDPSSSPGHHTRYLWISDLAAVTSPWIRSFCHLQELRVSTLPWDDTSGAPFLKLHGLSPTLKSLRLITSTTPPSKILDLICSFPLLEDLILYYQEPESDGDEWVAPPTSPKFTGTLHLTEDIRSVARRLLALPGGLHFANITIRCPVRHAGSAIGLVSRSSDTLESLIINYLFSSTSPPAPRFAYILPLECRTIQDTTSTGPVPCRKTQRHRVSLGSAKCSMDCHDTPDGQNQIPSTNHHFHSPWRPRREQGSGPSGTAGPRPSIG